MIIDIIYPYIIKKMKGKSLNKKVNPTPIVLIDESE